MLETARADFNGVFLSPSVTLGTGLPVTAGTLIPSVRLRYAGLFIDDYAETGPDGDLAVARRNVNVFEARGQLALALAPVSTPSQAWQTTLRRDRAKQRRRFGDIARPRHLFCRRWQEIRDARLCRRGCCRGGGAGMTLNAGFETGYGTDNAFTVRGQARLSKAF